MCRNRYASSPGRVETGSWVRSCRSTRPSSAVATSSAGSSSSSAPRQNTRPMSEPCRSTERQSGGRRSMRAAISACTVSGIRAEAPSPCSASSRIVSSTKSGLPSVLSRSARLTASGSSHLLGQRVDELLGLGERQRAELDRDRTASAATPRRSRLEQLRAGEAHDQHRGVVDPVGEVLDEVEQRLLRPVDVLEAEHERLGLGEVRRPLVRRPGDLLPASLPGHGVEHPGGEAEQIGDRVGRARLLQLLEGLLGRVVGRDAGGDLHHLGEREVREPLAERERAAGEDRRALETCEELVGEAALADPRLAVDRHELGAAVAHDSGVRVAEELELLLAADVASGDVDGSSARAVRARHPTNLEVVADALQRAALDALGDDPVGRQPERGRADQDLAGLGDLLESRGDVERLARRERRVPVLDDDLARFDPDPHRQLAVSRLDDPHRCPDGALGIVLVRDRDAEDGEHGVPGELLDGSPVRLDVTPRAVEELRHPSADDLRVARGDERARIDEVDEERGRELAFHVRSLGSGSRDERAVDRTATPEPGLVPISHKHGLRLEWWSFRSARAFCDPLKVRVGRPERGVVTDGSAARWLASPRARPQGVQGLRRPRDPPDGARRGRRLPRSAGRSSRSSSLARSPSAGTCASPRRR